MISLVVVVITVGIGGAFLTQGLVHSTEQKSSIEADEAMTMCDAGMERARQALGAYRGGATQAWHWKDIITYCVSSGRFTPLQMKADAKAFFATPLFAAYAQSIDVLGSNPTNAADNFDPLTPAYLPANQTTWSAGDTGKVLFGNTFPFQRGALYIVLSVTPDPSNTANVNNTVDPDNAYVTVTATLQSGMQRQVQGVLAKPGSVQKLKANGLAAIVSNDTVSLTGSITVDGRDHDYAGQNVTGPGVFGIISNSAMAAPSNGSVGGNGTAPPHPKGTAPGSTQGNYPFPNGYPATPDSALSMADGSAVAQGTLKNAAISAGTYFNNAAAYSNYLSSTQGGKASGAIGDGAIVYLEFTPGNGMFDLGSGNSKSSIMVVHTSTDSGIISEVHGNFTGLLLADGVVRNNGTSHIVGEVQVFSPTASQAGNVFGNGNAEIDFSSAALADLPGVAGNTIPPTPAKLLSYRRMQ
ncbi:MAG TPA: hypothetical protein VKW04_01895 [Planctomycetota bacterium]|nr:hypothetical protein [Planctomycetota bacterium]